MFHLDPTKRHDFVLLFDAENTNPNGDPDAGNMPRVDPETMHGFTTDVMIKRKVRDYLQITHSQNMFIQSETALNRLIWKAAKESGAEKAEVHLEDTSGDNHLADFFSQNEIENIEIDEKIISYEGDSPKPKEIKAALKIEDDVINTFVEELADDDEFKDKKKFGELLKSFTDRMCKAAKGKSKLDKKVRDKTRVKMIEDYYDIRMFGAVLSTGLNAGQVRGPMQLTFAKSLDPIFRMDCGITRKAVTKEADRKNKENAMGRKPIVNYGLYKGFGHYSPYLAQKEPMCEMVKDNIYATENDLKLFWEALWKGFDNDHSASRHIRPRGVYVFTHSNPRGNAPSHRLFQMLKVGSKEEVRQEERSPNQFSDYNVFLPENVLKIGAEEVNVSPAEDLKDAKEIPGKTVVFTKVYHE